MCHGNTCRHHYPVLAALGGGSGCGFKKLKDDDSGSDMCVMFVFQTSNGFSNAQLCCCLLDQARASSLLVALGISHLQQSCLGHHFACGAVLSMEAAPFQAWDAIAFIAAATELLLRTAKRKQALCRFAEAVCFSCRSGGIY